MLLLASEYTALPIEQKQTALKSLKLDILGNDNEKSKLVDHFDVLEQILLQESDPQLLQNTAVVVQSFSYLKKNIDFLLDRNTLDVLIHSLVKNPDLLAPVNLRTVVDILAFRSTSHLDLAQYGETGLKLVDVLYSILNNPRSDRRLLFDACNLIPMLKSSSLVVRLYKPLMKRISQEIAPVLKKVLILNNTVDDPSSFEDCESSFIMPKPPSEQSLVSSVFQLSPLFYSLSYMLKVIHEETDSRLKLPKPLYYVLTSFLNAYDLDLKLSATNVLVHYSLFFLSPDQRKFNYLKIAPVLTGLISRIKNLGNINAVNVGYKIPKEMSPIYLLAQIAEDEGAINDYLVGTNLLGKISSIITSNYSTEQRFLDKETVYLLSDCLLILSCIGGQKENYREMIIKHEIGPIIVDSLKRHYEVCKQVAATAKASPRELLIMKLSNRITLSACYLLRSLSRSASLLRTYLVNLDLVTLLINTLKIPEDLVQNYPEDMRQDEILLKSVVLGIISNLIIEFSAIKQQLSSDELSGILEGFIYRSNYDILKFNSLLVIRNSLFGDDLGFEENFKKSVSLEKIFELCYDPNPKIKEQCFNILRNLSVGSFNYASQIVSYFPNSLAAKTHGDATFLDFLLKHLEQAQDTEVVLAINYIIVHLAASDVENRSLIMCNDALLHKLLQFLKEKPTPSYLNTVTFNSDDLGDDQEDDEWKIRLSVVWTVINLTWKEETSGSDSENEDHESTSASDHDAMSGTSTTIGAATSGRPDFMEIDRVDSSQYRKYLSSKNRALKLIDLGFYEAIRNLNSHCHISDFKERARTAIFHLVLYDTTNQSN